MRKRLAAAGVLAAALALTGAGTAQAAKPPPPPPPTYSYAQCQTLSGGQMCVTVDPAGTANPDTSVTVSGTVACPAGNTWYGNVRVWQDVSGPVAKTDQVLVGGPQTQFACSGAPQPWTATTRPIGYHPGSARVIAVFSTQGPAGLSTVQVDTGDYQTTPVTAGVALA